MLILQVEAMPGKIQQHALRLLHRRKNQIAKEFEEATSKLVTMNQVLTMSRSMLHGCEVISFYNW